MSLLDQAEKDLENLLEDDSSGFGKSVILEEPSGVQHGSDGSLVGQSSDIGFFLDPGTGISTRGRSAEINLRLSTLNGLGIDFLSLKSGWKAIINDSLGNPWNFAIKDFEADRTLGIVKLILEILDVS